MPVLGQLSLTQRGSDEQMLSQSPRQATPINSTLTYPITILILAANPKAASHLRLDQEVREIEKGLARSRHRKQFRLEQQWAVRPQDMRRAMSDVRPQIIHFSSYGEGEEGLVLEDDMGTPNLVREKPLAALFSLFADRIKCVVVSGCYSATQAKAIAQHIFYIIGISREVGDRTAIEFAVSFYDALGAGRSIEFAYRLECTAIQFAGHPNDLDPVLIKRGVTNRHG